MKRFLFIQAILICIALSSPAQKKVERYCVFTRHLWNSYDKITFTLRQGKIDSLFSFKDSSIQTNLVNAAATIRTVPDLLNYMASQGWSLVPHQLTEFLIFKKEFDPSELKTP